MPPSRNILTAGLLLFLSVVPAQAHDPLQGITAFWLRPDNLEVEMTVALAPARKLVDNPPAGPITDENFETTYHALLMERAPNLFAITSNGLALKPLSMNVSFTDELDIRLDVIYPKPANGPLRITANFFGKMEKEFMNSVAVMQGRNTIAFGDQSADEPTFTATVGGAPIPTSPGNAPPPPPLPKAVPPSPATAPKDNKWLVPVVILATIIILVIWRLLLRARR